MKTFKADLDYESFLFSADYDEASPASLKIIKEFEYIFFLVNHESCALKNVRSYDNAYLKHLKNLGFVIPNLTPEAASYEYWWGQRHNQALEKKLNSKITSAQIAQKNGWGFNRGAIVKNTQEVLAHLEQFPQIDQWIIKRAHGFSGIGHYRFHASAVDQSVLEKILMEEVLLEPVYERVFDIGTTFEIHDGIIKRQFMIENFNSYEGKFKGGAGASDVNKFKKYIEKKYAYSLDKLEMITRQIAEFYLAMEAEANIQIDSFIYREQGVLQLYPLVEVNYRKTMGLVIQSLADRHPGAEHIEWKVLAHKEVGEEMNDWIKLSPEGNHFRSFYKQYLS